MKKLITIVVLCLLCSCMVGCSKNEPTCGGFPPPLTVSFDTWDEVRECYDVLNEDDETLEAFLAAKGYNMYPDGIHDRAQLEAVLQKMSSIRFAYPKAESGYLFDGISYRIGSSALAVSYRRGQNEAGTRNFVYDPAQWPPHLAVGEPVSSITVQGKQVELALNVTGKLLVGCYADEQVQCTLHLDVQPDGNPDDALQDAFVITDLNTVLFGEE